MLPGSREPTYQLMVGWGKTQSSDTMSENLPCLGGLSTAGKGPSAQAVASSRPGG